jgi:hypothetical protein
MFKRLFQKKKSDGLSKIEYWEKWEIFELFEDLHKAEEMLINAGDVKFDSDFVAFKDIFIKELYEIGRENVVDFTRVWEWFAPTKEWDATMGLAGKELGSQIFYRVDRWKKNHSVVE